jgi:hypothetical protein
MPLKNYRSEMPLNRIFDSITKMLVSHGARQLTYEYDGEGRVSGLAFSLSTPRGMVPIKLPARVEKVAHLMETQHAPGWRDPEQAYRTAWKNLHDWVAAQMALLETEMVKLEEVFLPYMLTPTGQTFFDTLEQKQFMIEGADNEEVRRGA